MKKIKRITAILLTAIIILTGFSNACAENLNMTSEETVKSIDETEYTLSDLPQYLLDTIQSNDKEVESLDLENINDEHSITTNNKDGSKTNYKFDIPIKYKNQNKILFKNPKIKKSNKLKEKTKKYNYESVENNFKTYFPQKLKDGILMEYENYKIEVSSINKIEYPLNEMTANEKDNIIKYSNIFSLDDYIEYIPTLNGLKENIVLNKYSGENTFKFKVNIGNLIPAFMEGESIPLLDKESNEIKMVIGQVDAKDSYVGTNENNDIHFSIYNNLKLESTNIDNEYVLTVSVDKEFLENDNTVYPVIIDPQISIVSSAMKDTTVYSGQPNSQTFYTSSYNNVGYHGSSYGEGIAFIQVGTMQNYKYINPLNISTAYYKAYEGSGKTNTSVIEIHDPDLIWNDNTITYNNKPPTANFDETKNVTVTTSGWYNFNITELLKLWLHEELDEGGWSQQYGFALKAQNSSASSKNFCSANNGNTSLLPYIVVNYFVDSDITSGTYFIKNLRQDKYLDAVDPEPGYDSGRTNSWDFHGDINQQWNVSKNSDGTYNLSPVSRPGFYLEVYQQSDTNAQPVTNYSHSPTSDAAKWRIIKNYYGSYRIMPVFSNTRCLDVYGGTDTWMTFSGRSFPKRNGTDVQLFSYNATPNQQWEFEKQLTPLIAQEKSNWCWAAVVKMSTGTSLSQSSIVSRLYGSPVDKSANPPEICNIANSVRSIGSPAFSIDYKAPTEVEIQTSLNSGRPVIGIVAWKNNGGAHAIVVSKYVVTSGITKYLVYDPYNVNVGTSTLCTYEQLKTYSPPYNKVGNLGASIK